MFREASFSAAGQEFLLNQFLPLHNHSQFLSKLKRKLNIHFKFVTWLTVTRDMLNHEFLNPWIVLKKALPILLEM